MKTIASSFFVLLAVARGAAPTPVERVISLLTKLTAEVQAEGHVEAASYDRYACFCKDQADEKVYVIAKSDKTIKDLTASIEALTGEITTLDVAVADKKKEVAGIEKTMKGNQETRNGEQGDYQKKRKSLAEAVEAVVGAMEAMKTSKANVDEEIASLLQKLPSKALSMPALALIADASAGKKYRGPGEAHAYQYDSKVVIDTLQQLTKTFKKELADLDEAEGNAQGDFEMAAGARANTITALEKSINEKETLSASKNEEKSDDEELKNQETTTRNADQAFLNDLTSKCEAKAKAWDQRSTTRASELTALTQGVELLRGMGDVYSSNKKLVGLVAKHSQTSFFQLRSVRHLSTDQFEELTSKLNEKASSLSSAPLAMLALQLQAAGPDHFVKVRGIIKDLISKLEADAKSEATAKGICDKNMKAAVTKRDKSAAATETANAQIDTTKAKINTLNTEIADLAEQIASLNKDLLEATELRNNEKAENEKTIENANTGKTAVDSAIKLLNKFYAGAKFLQADQKPNIKDSKGQTVGDLAPETFSSDEEYKGKVDSSKGIIGMLEVISSDFDRTATTVTKAEADSEKDYQTLKTDTEADITTKTKSKKAKAADVETKESDLTGFEGDLKDATKMNEQALEELEKLHASCVAGEETYAERVAHRNEEIAALKEAMEILDAWQN